MYLLLFAQGGQETPVGLFDTLENGRAFARALPGYRMERETDGDFALETEIFDPTQLADYQEIGYRGNLVPLTRFMFADKDRVELVWQQLCHLDTPGGGLVDSATRVDAYVIDNPSLKGYIARRESAYARVKAALEGRGRRVTRRYFGSQDGEAILTAAADGGDWHFLLHMDPRFVSEVPEDAQALEDWLTEQLEG